MAQRKSGAVVVGFMSFLSHVQNEHKNMYSYVLGTIFIAFPG